MDKQTIKVVLAEKHKAISMMPISDKEKGKLFVQEAEKLICKKR